MRTTIDLPDELGRAAKVRAAERGETLKEMLTRAIAREIAMDATSTNSRVKLPLLGDVALEPVVVTSEDIAAALAADDLRHAG